jgi:hypothetical protein
MKACLILTLLLLLGAAALLVPVSGRSFLARAQEHGIPAAVARVTAHGLRATWDFLSSLGHGSSATQPTRDPPAHSPRHASRKAQAAAPQPAPRAGREGIVPQPPKEKLERTDRAALDSLVAHSH